VIEHVRTAVSHIEVVNGSRVTLPTRISCGIARFRGYESPRDLIAEAEEHMYLDKAGSTSSLISASAPEFRRAQWGRTLRNS
jgi:PleD family two-component response regulator